MAPSNLGYSLREAGSHFTRNWTTSLGAVITIFLSLFIIGLFIVGSAMINSMIGSVQDTVKISAFISDDASDEDVEAFMEKIEGWDNVKNVEFKTKDDALEDFQSSSSDADATISALDGENPLPRSYTIEMNEPSQVEEMANKIKQDSDFQQIVDGGNVDESVLYGQEEVARLFQFTDYIRLAAVVLVALLTFVAFIFINNTIRLAILARRKEIGIMRLVGASNGFIRGPFLMEGAVHAVIGSALAIGAIELLRRFALPQVSNALMWLPIDLSTTVYLGIYALMFLFGLIIAAIGSLLAMRRYLKV